MTNAPTITSLEPVPTKKHKKGDARTSGPIEVQLDMIYTTGAKKAAELSPFTESEVRAMIRKAADKLLKEQMPTVADIVTQAIDALKADLGKL